MDKKATPKEVIAAMVADWRSNGLSYRNVAERTGYSYQTIANMASNKNSYFTPEQTEKFVAAFGYNPEFLLYGIGQLRLQESTSFMVWNRFLPDALKLEFLMDALKKIAEYSDDGRIRDLYTQFYQAMTTNDKNVCIGNLSNTQDILKGWKEEVESKKENDNDFPL